MYRRDREAAVLEAGVGLAILHVLDDAFVGKQPGTTAGDHLPRRRWSCSP